MQPSNNALLAHMEQLQKQYQEAVFVPWFKQKEARPLVVKEANGVYLTLANGEKLLDMKSQAFSNNLGHGHQGMLEALAKAAKNVRAFNSDTVCPERLALALDLRRIAPGAEKQILKKTFFTLGGAEANENAIKVARLFTKRHKIITRYRSYHGATLATINMSGDYRRIPVDSGMTGIIRFPDPYPRGSGQQIDTVRLLEEIIEIEGPET
ncbi:MAG TPA: aminotransferase class III-fold pyridoxal phosphate-dependent enzyme, partial [Myxococcota bacterium]|nr:aminotransferase class III-fold pyridoxal phosphate-dependent enzyme [Myxococcota bacterium]